jgi:hypothetical protein
MSRYKPAQRVRCHRESRATDSQCKSHLQVIARSERLIQCVYGISVAGAGADQMKRSVELDVRDRLHLVSNVDLRDGLGSLIFQSSKLF